jgi:hypothetical protein
VVLLGTVTVPNDRLVELLFRTDVGASTVKVAAALVALPALLLITTLN